MELRPRKKLEVTLQHRHEKVKTRLARPTGMADLPPEVLREIFLWSKCERTLPGSERQIERRNYHSHVGARRFLVAGHDRDTESEKHWGGVDFKIDPNTINPNEENPSYKSFGQVCRLWHHIVTPLLSETVILLQHTDSWAKADSICGCPHLAPFVRRFHMDANALQRITIPRSEPGGRDGLSIRIWRYNRDTPWFYGGVNQTFVRVDGGPLAKLLEDEESVYKRYKHWSQGEIAMATHHKNGTTPRIRLELLSNLQRVETVYRNDLATVKHRFDTPLRRGRATYWRMHDNLTRREVETMLYHNPGRHMDALYLTTFTKALEQSGLKIPGLTLREPMEILMMRETMSSLQSLRRLELNFENAGCLAFEDELNAMYENVAQYIGSFSALEELSIAMPISSTRPNHTRILNLLLDLTLPKLRNASLKKVRATYYTLKPFVEKHRDTLRSLIIKEPRIPLED